MLFYVSVRPIVRPWFGRECSVPAEMMLRQVTVFIEAALHVTLLNSEVEDFCFIFQSKIVSDLYVVTIIAYLIACTNIGVYQLRINIFKDKMEYSRRNVEFIHSFNGNHERKKPLWLPRHRLEVNNKMSLAGVVCEIVVWIHLSHKSGQR
jgi:hypothetical protein